jgi:hypothetical protein
VEIRQSNELQIFSKGIFRLSLTLSAKLAYNFSGKARRGGQDYYTHGQVRIRQGSATTVHASIKNSFNYGVVLDFEDDTLFATCGCLQFDREGACKHIWATILTAEAQGHLAEATAAQNLYIDFDDFPLDDAPDEPPTVAAAPVPIIRKLPPPRPPEPQPPAWRSLITQISNNAAAENTDRDAWPAKRQILYIIQIPKGAVQTGLVLCPETRDQKLDGSWSRSKPLNLKQSRIVRLPLAEDREILSLLVGTQQHYGWTSGDSWALVPTACGVKHPLAGILMPQLARTGRCYLRSGASTGEGDLRTPLAWDAGEPWRFSLQMRRRDKEHWAVTGLLRRQEEQMKLSVPALITEGGLVFTADRVAPLAEDTPFQCLLQLRQMGAIVALEQEREDLLSGLLCSPGLPPVEVPEELHYERVKGAPVPCLRVRPGNSNYQQAKARLRADLSFDYAGRAVPQEQKTAGWYDASGRQFLSRDFAAEESAAGILTGLGIKYQPATYLDPKQAWEIAPTKLPGIVRALVEAGWRVEAEGKILRRPGALRVEVSSGVDWFELRGEVQYGDSTAQLPELLQALRRGENMVRLGNGEYGILPEDWLQRFGHVAGMGTPVNGHLRFGRSQVGLLDALLAAQPEARCDETFARVRQEICSFQGIQPAEQPASFIGQLRDYQREGLGWMHFLQRFSFGGCLADDMGVGKTAQVLALLDHRRELRATQGAGRPSLVVVPRSLVFNWKLEAARFAPQLRVLDHTGLARNANNFADCDVVLTTYGTVRRDVLVLKEVEFDYIILDEAQAVKNANTESSKAVRLLRGQFRLALSGTPIENHLGELWTLFEFLNPGMLGTGSAFKAVSGSTRSLNEDARRLLASALRPFILRRTKEQVARELPPKTEQTIYCEMEPLQRKLYNDLLQHYRDSLLKRIETEGMEKSKIQVLEALLRLRQAACHPGLLDPKRKSEPSAKLEVLLAQVSEVIEEGHKALVFSQFTSLLEIVRRQLNEKGIVYEYLDGKTRDRQARVERFQNHPDCKLFLVSLKAGGLGLNLTAAEYVFLLDPWWNPAVEAQAVDRAHRIGQTQQVFAYRLIAKDTVEEKVLELQHTKRDLAAAIISADNSVIRNLKREDLEILLS